MKHLLYLILLMVSACHHTNDKETIINRYKDVYLVHNTKEGYFLYKINGYFGIELSNIKPSSIMQLKVIAFYDIETKKLLFSYTRDSLLQIRGSEKNGNFILTESGLIYELQQRKR